MSGLLNDFIAWLKSPFGNGVSALQLTFGIGLVIVIVLFWVFILERLEGSE